MSLFETTAFAAEAAGPGADAGIINLIMLAGFVLIFYFLLIRPQNKRRKEHQELVSSLNKGDEVVTAGCSRFIINNWKIIVNKVVRCFANKARISIINKPKRIIKRNVYKCTSKNQV